MVFNYSTAEYIHTFQTKYPVSFLKLVYVMYFAHYIIVIFIHQFQGNSLKAVFIQSWMTLSDFEY